MIEHPTDDLGLYALGLLDREERAAITRHLSTCDTCRRELEAYDATVASLADGVQAPAPAEVREAIVARHRPRLWRGWQLLPLAASLVLAIALVASLAALQQERAARDDYGRALAALASGGRIVALSAKDGGARGAIVQARDGSTYLVLDLPPAPSGKGYEAWVIHGGTPRPAGMAPAPSGVVVMQIHEVNSGDVAAITLEDAAGVQAPTTEPLLLGQL